MTGDHVTTRLKPGISRVVTDSAWRCCYGNADSRLFRNCGWTGGFTDTCRFLWRGSAMKRITKLRREQTKKNKKQKQGHLRVASRECVEDTHPCADVCCSSISCLSSGSLQSWSADLPCRFCNLLSAPCCSNSRVMTNVLSSSDD